jgi:hypothetical protein
VQALVLSRYVFFKPRIIATIAAGLTAAGKLKVVDEMILALQEYVDALGSGQDAEGQAILAALQEVDDVLAVMVVDVIVWRSDIGRPSTETLIDALIDAVRGAGSDEVALRLAINTAVSETPPLVPTSTRIPDRSLLLGPGGAPATDEEIESGQFKVSATVEGLPWWVVLDLEPADIVIREEEG